MSRDPKPQSHAEPEPDPIAAAAPGILAHMNKDHAEALLDYARALCGIDGATSAVMTAVDRDGFEMRVELGGGEAPQSARLAWESPVSQSDEVRKALINLLKKARAKKAGSDTNKVDDA